MKNLAARIPTNNEEHPVEGVPVAFADEIMVVDSFSKDKTIEPTKKYTDFIPPPKKTGQPCKLPMRGSS